MLVLWACGPELTSNAHTRTQEWLCVLVILGLERWWRIWRLIGQQTWTWAPDLRKRSCLKRLFLRTTPGAAQLTHMLVPKHTHIQTLTHIQTRYDICLFFFFRNKKQWQKYKMRTIDLLIDWTLPHRGSDMPPKSREKRLTKILTYVYGGHNTGWSRIMYIR